MNLVIPTLRYQDPDEAIRWLCEVVGMGEHAVYRNDDGSVSHAELSWGEGFVMLGKVADGDFGVTAPAVTYLTVASRDDIDSSHRRAEEMGAEVVMPPTEQDYGSREFAVRDPEGNVWSIGTYRPPPSGAEPSH